jgi:hypothetical protein
MVFAFQRESLGVDAIVGPPFVSVKDILRLVRYGVKDLCALRDYMRRMDGDSTGPT